jgi:hypothetical protein
VGFKPSVRADSGFALIAIKSGRPTRAPGARAALKNAVAALFLEGGSEMVTEFINITDETLCQGHPFDLDKTVQRVREAGLTGAVMGPQMSGGVAGAQGTDDQCVLGYQLFFVRQITHHTQRSNDDHGEEQAGIQSVRHWPSITLSAGDG